jgi:hypothetical protein
MQVLISKERTLDSSVAFLDLHGHVNQFFMFLERLFVSRGGLGLVSNH